MGSRWDRLLDVRKVTLVDHLLTEAAKVVVKDLETWPPPVESMEPETREKFAAVFAPDQPAPPRAAILESFRLARWDLERNFEAYEDYVRNRRWTEHDLADEHRDVLLFVSRWLVEHLLSLGEATEGRIKRPQMIVCLDRIHHHLH